MVDFVVTPRGSLLVGVLLVVVSRILGSWVKPALLQWVLAEPDSLASSLFGLVLSGFEVVLETAFGVGIVLIGVAVVLAKIDRVQARRSD